ncbi:MAG: hypothetical protein FWB74_05785 [Defluviitaleaceae bacterium]|nr:hypothetical protein [Defluviitaleaceae bacterium]
MKKNVFAKMKFREPVKTGLLVILVAVATFAFVARAVEYFIVSEEIARIEGYYRSVGNLVPLNSRDVTNDRDVTQAAELLAGSPLIDHEDRRVFVQGIMSDRYNTVLGGISFWRGFFPEWVSLGNYYYATVSRIHFPFSSRQMLYRHFEEIAELEEAGHIIPAMARGARVWITLIPDEIVVADPNVIRTEPRRTRLAGTDRYHVVYEQHPWDWTLSLEEAIQFLEGEHPLNQLQMGQRYLFWWSNTGQKYAGGDEPIFFIDANDQDMLDAFFEAYRAEMDLADQTIRTMHITGTRDMTAIPRAQVGGLYRLTTGHFLQGGRWLTEGDYLEQNHVAVIPIHMATRRGLRIGDTLTLTLRDNPRPSWIDAEEPGPRPWAEGNEGWWHREPQGFWSATDRTANWQDVREYEIEVIIVGVYDFHAPPLRHHWMNTHIYVPISILPEGFGHGWEDMPLLSSMYTFVLDSPRDEAAFLAAYEIELYRLGFRPNFLPNGFDNFIIASDPIQTTITLNLVIFGVSGVMILLLVVFLYLRNFRKSVAISRALGMPTKKTMGKLFAPAFGLWSPAIVLGAALAWLFAINQAEITLGDMEEVAIAAIEATDYYAEADIVTQLLAPPPPTEHIISGLDRSPVEILALSGGIAVLLFSVLIGSGFVMAKKPVLEQLQGGARKRVRGAARSEKLEVRSEIEIDAGSTASVAALAFVRAPGRIGAANRQFMFRQIFRSPVKSGLIVVTAMFFVISLGWLNHTIEFTQSEIERLWDTTVVPVDVVSVIDDDAPDLGFWMEIISTAPISRTVFDNFLEAELVTDVYAEALWMQGLLRSPQVMEYYMSGDFEEIIWRRFWQTNLLLGVASFEGFVAENSRTALDDARGTGGYDIQIRFAEGFSGEDFVFGGPNTPIPILVRQSFLDYHEYTLGMLLVMNEFGVYFRVIGVFEDGVHRGAVYMIEDEFRLNRNVSIVPLDALLHHTAHIEEIRFAELSFFTVKGAIDPAFNRNANDLHEYMAHVLYYNVVRAETFFVPTELELIIADGELRGAVEPMERNLELLRALYPIAIGAAILLSLGLALLIMLQNIKTAAVMRVLGKTKAQSNAWLSFEYILVCAAGVALGLLALLIIGVEIFVITPITLAGIYFAASILGAAIGAVLIGIKTPFELLQVKE